MNVFLGRLNAFVADNGLGDGTYVGERATLASQRAIRRLRETAGVPTRQTAASLRSGSQVRDLAGMDLMTLPPKAAAEFLQLDLRGEQIVDCTDRIYQPPLAEGVDPTAVRLETLWDIPQSLVDCLDALDAEDPDGFGPDDLVGFLAERGCGDLFIRWSDQQIATSADEGKIPSLQNWRDALAAKAVGLDSLMNLAGLNSFRADQQATDKRVASVLAGA